MENLPLYLLSNPRGGRAFGVWVAMGSPPPPPPLATGAPEPLGFPPPTPRGLPTLLFRMSLQASRTADFPCSSTSLALDSFLPFFFVLSFLLP